MMRDDQVGWDRAGRDLAGRDPDRVEWNGNRARESLEEEEDIAVENIESLEWGRRTREPTPPLPQRQQQPPQQPTPIPTQQHQPMPRPLFPATSSASQYSSSTNFPAGLFLHTKLAPLSETNSSVNPIWAIECALQRHELEFLELQHMFHNSAFRALHANTRTIQFAGAISRLELEISKLIKHYEKGMQNSRIVCDKQAAQARRNKCRLEHYMTWLHFLAAGNEQEHRHLVKSNPFVVFEDKDSRLSSAASSSSSSSSSAAGSASSSTADKHSGRRDTIDKQRARLEKTAAKKQQYILPQAKDLARFPQAQDQVLDWASRTANQISQVLQRNVQMLLTDFEEYLREKEELAKECFASTDTSLEKKRQKIRSMLLPEMEKMCQRLGEINDKKNNTIQVSNSTYREWLDIVTNGLVQAQKVVQSSAECSKNYNLEITEAWEVVRMIYDTIETETADILEKQNQPSQQEQQELVHALGVFQNLVYRVSQDNICLKTEKVASWKRQKYSLSLFRDVKTASLSAPGFPSSSSSSSSYYNDNGRREQSANDDPDWQQLQKEVGLIQKRVDAAAAAVAIDKNEQTEMGFASGGGRGVEEDGIDEAVSRKVMEMETLYEILKSTLQHAEQVLRTIEKRRTVQEMTRKNFAEINTVFKKIITLIHDTYPRLYDRLRPLKEKLQQHERQKQERLQKEKRDCLPCRISSSGGKKTLSCRLDEMINNCSQWRSQMLQVQQYFATLKEGLYKDMNRVHFDLEKFKQDRQKAWDEYLQMRMKFEQLWNADIQNVLEQTGRRLEIEQSQYMSLWLKKVGESTPERLCTDALGRLEAIKQHFGHLLARENAPLKLFLDAFERTVHTISLVTSIVYHLIKEEEVSFAFRIFGLRIRQFDQRLQSLKRASHEFYRESLPTTEQTHLPLFTRKTSNLMFSPCYSSTWTELQPFRAAKITEDQEDELLASLVDARGLHEFEFDAEPELDWVQEPPAFSFSRQESEKKQENLSKPIRHTLPEASLPEKEEEEEEPRNSTSRTAVAATRPRRATKEQKPKPQPSKNTKPKPQPSQGTKPQPSQNAESQNDAKPKPQPSQDAESQDANPQTVLQKPTPENQLSALPVPTVAPSKNQVLCITLPLEML